MERELKGTERFIGNDELVRAKIRTFELLSYITAPPDTPSFPCTVLLEDMPSNMRDAVFEAMERKSADVGLQLAIVHCVVDEDHEYVEGVTPSKWFMHIVLSEVIVAPDMKSIHGGGA